MRSTAKGSTALSNHTAPSSSERGEGAPGPPGSRGGVGGVGGIAATGDLGGVDGEGGGSGEPSAARAACADCLAISTISREASSASREVWYARSSATRSGYARPRALQLLARREPAARADDVAAQRVRLERGGVVRVIPRALHGGRVLGQQSDLEAHRVGIGVVVACRLAEGGPQLALLLAQLGVGHARLEEAQGLGVLPVQHVEQQQVQARGEGAAAEQRATWVDGVQVVPRLPQCREPRGVAAVQQACRVHGARGTDRLR
eukprot:scaffold61455_cov60-Phaeocystis_antarctica.AAC.1